MRRVGSPGIGNGERRVRTHARRYNSFLQRSAVEMEPAAPLTASQAAVDIFSFWADLPAGPLEEQLAGMQAGPLGTHS